MDGLLNFPTKQYITYYPPHLKYVAALCLEKLALELRHCRRHRSAHEHRLKRRRVCSKIGISWRDI